MNLTKAKDLIKSWEKCRLSAYKDSGKPPVITIGWGSTRHLDGSLIKLGEVITQELADEMFDASFKRMLTALEKEIIYENLLSENQFAAICSLVYNIGETAFEGSTLRKKLNTYSPLTTFDWAYKMSQEFPKWTYDNGVHIEGLANRRRAERELFLSDD